MLYPGKELLMSILAGAIMLAMVMIRARGSKSGDHQQQNGCDQP